MEGIGNSSPSPNNDDMDGVEISRRELEKMSTSTSPPCTGAAVAAALDGEYHANSILSLIAERRKSLEEKKLIRRAEWTESVKEEIEERANFKSAMMQLPDLANLAWEYVFEYITDPNERRMLRNMAKPWRELMLNERTSLLISSVLKVLFKTGCLKIEEAFHCRLVCKEWKRTFDQCLQDTKANSTGTDAKRDCSWEELTKHAPRFPTSREEQAAFTGMFPPDQNPFIAYRSAKFFSSQEHLDEHRGIHGIDVIASLGQLGMEIDCLFLDLSMNHRFQVVLLKDNHPNLKHLGIHNATDDSINFHSVLPSCGVGLETVWLYNVHPYIWSTILSRNKETLKTVIRKGTSTDIDPYRPNTFSLLGVFQSEDPFPNLKTLILDFVSHRLRLFDEPKNSLPSLEELQCTGIKFSYADVLKFFGWVNRNGSNLRKLHLDIDLQFRNDFYYVFASRHQVINYLRMDLKLPKLEMLELTLHLMEQQRNIDFILPCESLKEFHLSVFKKLKKIDSLNITNAAKGGVNEKNEALQLKDSSSGDRALLLDEIIAYNGFEERMYESNIWDIFPDLRKLRISVVTVNTDGWMDEDEKVSKFYTRDGFKQQNQEEKKEK